MLLHRHLDGKRVDDVDALVDRMTLDVDEVRRLEGGESEASEAIVEHAIAALGEGRMIVLTGGAHRPGDVDLVVAADHADAKAINTMARDARGLICLAMPAARCDALALPPMRGRPGVEGNDELAFTISIEARDGVTTGISAADRARTIAAAVSPSSTANDLVRPGHVFPIRVEDRGVLGRDGRPEAALALAELANLRSAAVTCAVMDDDGAMMTADTARDFAAQHGFVAVDVADVVRYVRSREARVAHIGSSTVTTAAGDAVVSRYISCDDGALHIAIEIGDMASQPEVPVRVQRADVLPDVFGGGAARPGPLDVLRDLSVAGGGILVYLGDRSWSPNAPNGAASRSVSDAAIVAEILAERGVAAPVFSGDRT